VIAVTQNSKNTLHHHIYLASLHYFFFLLYWLHVWFHEHELVYEFPTIWCNDISLWLGSAPYDLLFPRCFFIANDEGSCCRFRWYPSELLLDFLGLFPTGTCHVTVMRIFSSILLSIYVSCVICFFAQIVWEYTRSYVSGSWSYWFRSFSAVFTSDGWFQRWFTIMMGNFSGHSVMLCNSVRINETWLYVLLSAWERYLYRECRHRFY